MAADGKWEGGNVSTPARTDCFAFMARNRAPYRGVVALGVLAHLVGFGCKGDRYLEEFVVEPRTSKLEFIAPEQLTAGNEDSFSPDLSPNGEYVIYTSTRRGNKDIWEKRTRGGYSRPLTMHAADDFSPVISPDGKKLAFVSRREDAAGDIHVLDFASQSRLGGLFGGQEGDIVAISSPSTEDANPAWFPGSDKIVFASRAPGEALPRLMIADLETLKPEPLADLRGDQPAISPDGSALAFVRSGAIFIYHLSAEKLEQITEGGLIQDGQPRFSEDGKTLVFRRYADDTNGDGKLNGDDRPSVWQLDLDRQRGAKNRENYTIEPLTAAAYAYFSPQVRGPYLYTALQTSEGLNIFRLPAGGQLPPFPFELAPGEKADELGQIRRQAEQRADYFERVFVLRRGESALARQGKLDVAAEVAVIELDGAVLDNRRQEAQSAAAKIKANFPTRSDLIGLADLAIAGLDLAPLAYPRYAGDLSPDQGRTLAALLARTDPYLRPHDGAVGGAYRRLNGRARLLKARILAAQRQFFEASKVLVELVKSQGQSDPALSAEAALEAAIITPAISDADAAIVALKEVVRAYPMQPNIVRRAAEEAVRLAESRPNRAEALLSLRLKAKGLPVMPALAHRKIADHFLEDGKDSVAANELRQIVDLYPESPGVVIAAAEALTTLEEKAGRYEQAESTLQALVQRLGHTPADVQERLRRLKIDFWIHRGEALLRAKKPDLALQEYGKVIAFDPSNVNAHRGRIDAAFQRGGAEALEPLKELYAAAAEDHPASPEWLYIYGYALTYDVDLADSLSGRITAIDRSISVIEEARQTGGQLLQIHQTLGWLYLQRNFTGRQYERSGSWVAGAKKRFGLIREFFGVGDPDWRELAVDSYQNAYFLSRPDSLERAGLAQNLGQAYYSMKNHQKSLSYYLQRVKLLPVVPMRDARAEAILLERAGRSAFQIAEHDGDLALAESLQRSALSAWEGVGNEDRIAYGVDALALTVRERGRFRDAGLLYDRLNRLQIRLKLRENRVGTLSNLGYCAFMDSQNAKALEFFESAEDELQRLEQGRPAVYDEVAGKDKEAKSGDDELAPVPAKAQKADAIKVDLGGQASAAKGFDLFGRHDLILSFRTKIYEQIGRLDLALRTIEKRLILLKDGQDEGRNVTEEISLVENAIGDMRLRAGDHVKSREAFREAAAAAKSLRPKDQKFRTPGELINELNVGRVQLRLGSLGVATSAEIEQSERELDAAATELRPIYEEGARAQGRPLSQLLTLSSALTSLGGGEMNKVNAELNDSLKILAKVDAPAVVTSGTLFAYQAAVGGSTVDEVTAAQLQELRKAASSPGTSGMSPHLEWKLAASAGQYQTAYESVGRLIENGTPLRVSADRQTVRMLFEHLLRGNLAPISAGNGGGKGVGKVSASDPPAEQLLRRYLTMRLTDMILRAGLDPSSFSAWLSLKEPSAIGKVLGKADGILLMHRFLNGDVVTFARTRDKVIQVVRKIPVGQRLDPKAYSALFDGAEGLFAALPPAGGRLYVVPSAELFEVPWEKVTAGGETLGSRFHISYVPSPEMLPGLFGLRRLAKISVAHVIPPPIGVEIGEGDGEPLDAIAEVQALRAANKDRDVVPVYFSATDPGAGNKNLDPSARLPLLQRLRSYNVIHADAPLWLQDVEPGLSVLAARGPGFGAEAHLGDLTLKQLASSKLPLATALIFNNVHRLGDDLSQSGEGHDGWSMLSLAAAAAGVPSVLAIDRPLPADDQKPFPLTGPQIDWAAFYGVLATKSLSEAAKETGVPGRVLGYGGILGAEEEAFAKERLPKAVEEAEDARGDQDFEGAAFSYMRAIAYARRLGKSDQEGEYLSGIVQSYFQKRDYAAALKYKLRLAERVKASPPQGKGEKTDSVEYGRALVDAAVLAVRAERTDQAEQLLNDAEGIFVSENDPAQLGKIWQYRAINAETRRDFDRTIASYEKARQYYLKAKPDEAVAILLALGNVYRNNLSDYQKAIELYGQAISGFQKLGKKDLYVPVLIDLANTRMMIGDLEGAISLLELQVVTQLDLQKQRGLLVRANQTLANAYFRAGLYQEARDLNDRVFQEAAKVEPKTARADRQVEAVGLRAMILAKLGRPKEAFEDFRAAIKMAKEFGIKYQIALLYNNYGFWAREYGAVDQSIEFFTIARQIDEELKSRSSIAYDDRNMGLSIILKGDYGRAKSLLNGSLAVSEELHLAYNAAYCHFGLGDMAMREDDAEEAERHFRKSLHLAERSSMLDFAWRAHAGIGGALAKIGRSEEAAAAFEHAIETLEGLRAGLKSEDSRSGFYSDAGVQEVYEAYSAILMRLGRHEAAFTASERARSRAHIDAVGTRKLPLAKTQSALLLAQEKPLKAAVADIQRRMGVIRASGGVVPEGLTAALKAATDQYAAHIAKMRSSDAQLADLVRVDAISKEELSKILGPNAALISFQVTAESVLVWVVRAGKIFGATVPISAKELGVRIRDIRLLMQNYSATDYLGRELSNLLIGPVASHLAGVTRLAIVPHASLHFVPFAALPWPGHADKDPGRTTTDVLMDHASLVYLDSATLARYTMAGARKDLRGASVLALANPAVKGRTLEDLPFAGKEVAVIGRYFNRVEVAVGDAASSELIKDRGGAAGVLHLAAHGEFLANAAADSALLLAPSKGSDGRLSTTDVFGLKSAPELVTLSACDTAVGRLTKADEVISLDRAFFYAGAGTVVSSLWRINDVASAVTMKRFYRYLSEGKSRAEALRQAQMVVRRYFPHPAYWGAFRMLGDDR